MFAKQDRDESPLLSITINRGRLPDYRPWIEVYNITREVRLGKRSFLYPGSEVETIMLERLGAALGPGQSIFVAYGNDDETRTVLAMDAPACVSRLGFRLLSLGFTWFKDWYFPEGWLEGDPKLQAEKPLDEAGQLRQIDEICGQAGRFLVVTDHMSHDIPYLLTARARTSAVLTRHCFTRRPDRVAAVDARSRPRSLPAAGSTPTGFDALRRSDPRLLEYRAPSSASPGRLSS
jgi:hypothetical protein